MQKKKKKKTKKLCIVFPQSVKSCTWWSLKTASVSHKRRHRHACSARIAQNSFIFGSGAARKVRKMSCTPPREKTLRAPKANFCHHRNDVIFGARTQANVSSINQPSAAPALIRYFKLNTACQDGPLCKNGNACVNLWHLKIRIWP